MKNVFSVILSIIFLASVVFFSVSCSSNSKTETSMNTIETTITDTTEATSEETTENESSYPVEETTETETSTTESGSVIPSNRDFDESKIVFTFAAISDTHIENTKGVVANKFVNALTQLKERANKDCEAGLGAVFAVGDLINNGHKDREYYKEITYFTELYESVLDPEQVPMVFCIGNHDTLCQLLGD